MFRSRCPTELIRVTRARAAVAQAGDESTLIIKDKSVAIVDYKTTDMLTSSLINATNVEKKLNIIETAEGWSRANAFEP